MVGCSACRRAERSRPSCSLTFAVRPLWLAVHRARSGQWRQAAPYTATRLGVTVRVSPAGEFARPEATAGSRPKGPLSGVLL